MSECSKLQCLGRSGCLSVQVDSGKNVKKVLLRCTLFWTFRYDVLLNRPYIDSEAPQRLEVSCLQGKMNLMKSLVDTDNP